MAATGLMKNMVANLEKHASNGTFVENVWASPSTN
jgi:hypothetical protein